MKTKLTNNALAHLILAQILAAKTNEIKISPAAQNSAQKGLELAKKFEKRLDIKIPASASLLAQGKPLSKAQLEQLVRTFDERGWDVPKPVGDGWMNQGKPSADWIECLLHGGSSHWAIESLSEMGKPEEETGMTPSEEVFSKN